jgi:hypothetical protein
MADINLGVGGANSATGGYEIENSLKLEQDNSEYLKATNTFASTTPTSITTGTFSCWVKRTEIGAGGYQASVFVSGNSARYAVLYFENDQIKIYSGDSSFNSTYPLTNAVFRDTSAWYHIVLKFDSTDSTAANRLRLYVNGEEQTWSTAPNITQNGIITFAELGSPTWHGWGQNYGYASPTNFFSGYLAEAQYIDGQALAPTEFGETDSDSGIWKPKEYDGTYGNAGYYLDFEDSSNLGNDVSGNGFDFNLTNITSADQATDTPTNNFAIPNVIGTTRTNKFTYTEGGTKVVSAGSADWDSWANTIAVGNGKWYAEFKIINTGSYFVGVGSEEYYFIGAGNGTGFPEIYYGYTGTNSVGYHGNNGDIYNNGTQVVIGTTYTANDIISVALDMDNGKVYFAKNGTYINSQNPVTGTNAQNLPDTEARYFIGTSQFQASLGVECNYGGYTTTSIASSNSDANGYGTFEYAPPTGYYALCTKNLAEYG